MTKQRASILNSLSYSQQGLRTLCVAEKDFSAAAFADWNARFHAASVAIEGREAKISEVAEEAEQGLRLLGCTAVEDRLQDGVPDCIATIVAAGKSKEVS